MSARVFITQENRLRDYSDAEQYGEIQFLTSKEFSPHRNSKQNIDIINEIKDGLKDWTPEDYILICGHPITASIVLHHVIEKYLDYPIRFDDDPQNGEINVLVWKGKEGKYRKYTLPEILK